MVATGSPVPRCEGRTVNREEAIAILLRDVNDIRRYTIYKIKVRRRFLENHNNVSTDMLLLRAKRDFITERKFMRLVKSRIEKDLGEELGPVEDQDGRQI